MSLLTGDGGEEEEGGEVCLPPQERKRGGRSKKGKKKVRRVTRLAEVSCHHQCRITCKLLRNFYTTRCNNTALWSSVL